jgi:hypothetical protein
VHLDPLIDQEAGKPEAIIACFGTDLEGDRSATVAGSSCCKPGEDIEQSGWIATWNKRGGDLGAPWQEGADQPPGAAQLESDVAVLGGRDGHGRSPCSSVETSSTLRPGLGPA